MLLLRDFIWLYGERSVGCTVFDFVFVSFFLVLFSVFLMIILTFLETSTFFQYENCVDFSTFFPFFFFFEKYIILDKGY
jgi:hypothetical protein